MAAEQVFRDGAVRVGTAVLVKALGRELPGDRIVVDPGVLGALSQTTPNGRPPGHWASSTRGRGRRPVGMLHVSVLGEQAITGMRTGVQCDSSRAVVLVAFLATHAGSPQARQRIAGLFWPDSTDAQALTNLRRELHHLRHVLGDEPSLVVTARELCWQDTETCRVDLRIFDIEREAAVAAAAAGDDKGVLVHAAAAAAQYRGDLLPGVYDDWLLDARSALERQCTDLCDLLGATRARDLTGAVDAAADPAAAAGGGRLSHPDAAAGRPGRPCRRREQRITDSLRSWYATWCRPDPASRRPSP